MKLCEGRKQSSRGQTPCLFISSREPGAGDRQSFHMTKASAQCLNTPSPILWNSKFLMSRAMIIACELRTLGMYASSFLSCGNAFSTAAIFLWEGETWGLFFVLSCDGMGVVGPSTISTTKSSTSCSSCSKT